MTLVSRATPRRAGRRVGQEVASPDWLNGWRRARESSLPARARRAGGGSVWRCHWLVGVPPPPPHPPPRPTPPPPPPPPPPPRPHPSPPRWPSPELLAGLWVGGKGATGVSPVDV